jgi:capsule polysaccharide export protein KpsE/RkpR
MARKVSVSDTYRATPGVVSNRRQVPATGGDSDVLGRLWDQFRHTWRLILRQISFWTIVGAAVGLSSVYYFVFAESLYDSTAIVSVQNKGSATTSVLGGIIGSAAGASQVEQLYQYIISPDMLKLLDSKFHLRRIYASSERNPFWRLWWPSSDEAFLNFYRNMVDILPDTTDSLLTIDALDYDAHRSQAIAAEIVSQSQKFMNYQSVLMQAQSMKYAEDELRNSVKAVQAAKIPYEQTVAELRLSAAQSGLATATGLANAQQTFVIPVSKPSFPTYTTRPQRLLDIAGIALMVAMSYAVGFLMWANVRDHRKT